MHVGASSLVREEGEIEERSERNEGRVERKEGEMVEWWGGGEGGGWDRLRERRKQRQSYIKRGR